MRKPLQNGGRRKSIPIPFVAVFLYIIKKKRERIKKKRYIEYF